MTNAFFGALLFFYTSQCHRQHSDTFTDKERAVCSQVAMLVDPDYMSGGVYAPRDWKGH